MEYYCGKNQQRTLTIANNTKANGVEIQSLLFEDF